MQPKPLAATAATAATAGDASAQADDPLLSGLCPEQSRVVLAPNGPLLVLAPAGSGKTRVLTHRVAHLLRQGVSPDRMLLLTFTNQAARQMLGRLSKLVCGSLRDMWVGTFHSLALRAVRTFGQQLGLSPRSSVLDQTDAVALFASCLDEAVWPQSAPVPRPALLHSLWSLSVATEQPLETVLHLRVPSLLSHRRLISQALDRYCARKIALGVCDFDDLLLAWRLLLYDCPQARDSLQTQFLHVFVDEYQDVSPLQSSLADELAALHRSLTVVGDDAQSIYRFRGADAQAMHTFSHRWPDAQTLHLSLNFRCQPDIVAVSNRCLGFTAPGQLLPRPVARALETQSMSMRPAVVEMPDGRFQASFVVCRVRELLQSGQKLGDLAVLYRHHRQAKELVAGLAQAGIPYAVRSGQRLCEQPHVKDALAVFQVLLNPCDGLAWTRILKQVPGLGEPGRAAVLASRVAAQPWNLEAPKNARKETRQGLAGLELVLHKLSQGCERAAERPELLDELPGLLCQTLLSEHYAPYAAHHFTDAKSRLAELEALFCAALNRTADAQGTLPIAPKNVQTKLSDFLSALALGVENDETPTDKLLLSSVHQAKGLEWNVVFVLWLVEGQFPSAVALLDVPSVSDAEAEERRLFYVAVTRARRELYLCCPRFSPTQGTLRPSRFVRELCDTKPLCERWQVGETTTRF